jgi:hypothetical protein
MVRVLHLGLADARRRARERQGEAGNSTVYWESGARN